MNIITLKLLIHWVLHIELNVVGLHCRYISASEPSQGNMSRHETNNLERESEGSGHPAAKVSLL